MSIATDMNRLTIAKSGIITSLTNKGVMVPNDVKVNEFPNLIDSISSAAPNGTRWEKGNATDLPMLNSSTSYMIREFAYYNGRWAAATQTGMIYSDDGINWHKTNITSNVFKCVCVNDGIWIAGSSQHGLYRSTDGAIWSQISSTEGLSVNKIATNRVEWVAALSKGALYSDDYKVLRWRDTGLVQESFTHVGYYLGLWIIGCYKSTYCTADVTRWRQCRGISGSFDASFYNGRYFAIDNTQTADLYSSTDGLDWVLDSSYEGWFNRIIPSDRACLILSEEGIYYSKDGINWQKTNVTAGDFMCASKACGVWVACAMTHNIGTYYSLDGLNWKLTNITTGYAYDVQNHGGIWVIGGRIKDGVLYYSKSWEPM